MPRTFMVNPGTMPTTPHQARVVQHEGSTFKIDERVPSWGKEGPRHPGGRQPTLRSTSARPWQDTRVFGVNCNPKNIGSTGGDGMVIRRKITNGR